MNAIALDAMGGDFMPRAAVEGALLAADEGIEAILVGEPASLERELTKAGRSLPVHPAEDLICMMDNAADVRHRRQSSIMQAMQLVKTGEASACVSMGHSGASMAAALFVLGRVSGVERPAILADMPLREGYVALLDVGANADCRPSHLQQFAVMGSVYARACYKKAEPTVGLMSIGEEAGKGNELVREAFPLLKAAPNISFYGNVEGRDLFRGTTDVVVTDGFTGNVVLKLAEGEARFLFGWIRDALSGGSALTRVGALAVKPALRQIATRLDPAEYGAQPLLGVDGHAFIGHGSSDARAVLSALRRARQAVEADLVGNLKRGMATLESAPAMA